MPPTGGEALEEGLLRLPLVEVKRLRILPLAVLKLRLPLSPHG